MHMKIVGMLCLAVGLTAFAKADYRLYNIVPMYIGHEAEQAARCVEMQARTGEDLALYSLTLHPEGRPSRSCLRLARGAAWKGRATVSSCCCPFLWATMKRPSCESVRVRLSRATSYTFYACSGKTGPQKNVYANFTF